MEGKAAGGSRQKTSLRNAAKGEGKDIVGSGNEMEYAWCLLEAKNCL
jgi:hypothetical protein